MTWKWYPHLLQVSGNSRSSRFCAYNIQSCPCSKFRPWWSKLSKFNTKTKCYSNGEFEVVLERRCFFAFLFRQVPPLILAASCEVSLNWNVANFIFFFLWYNNHIFLEFYRYTSWLSTGLTARKTGNTSTSPGSEWAVSSVADDFIFVCIMPWLLHIYLLSAGQFFCCSSF